MTEIVADPRPTWIYDEGWESRLLGRTRPRVAQARG